MAHCDTIRRIRLDDLAIKKNLICGHKVPLRPPVIPGVGEAARDLQDARARLVQPLLLQYKLDLRAGECEGDERVAERLGCKHVAPGHGSASHLQDIRADAAKTRKGDHCPAALIRRRNGQLRIGQNVAEHAFAILVLRPSQRLGDETRPVDSVCLLLSQCRVETRQFGLRRVLGKGLRPHNDVLGTACGYAPGLAVERDINSRHHRSEPVGTGNKMAIDITNVGSVRSAADYQPCCTVESLDDVHNRACQSWAFVVAA